MRHRKKGRKFGRVRKVRRAFFKSLIKALISKERIMTTEARAKEIRPMTEKLLTKAKKGDMASRRIVASSVGDEAAKKLFTQIAPKFSERHGGYTRIIKMPRRKSDSARMAIIELIKS